MSALHDDMAAELIRLLTHPEGAFGRMKDCEAENGYSVIPAGATFPIVFSADDWRKNSLVSLHGREVRIVAITALTQGNGALRRLINNITAANLTPVVVEPMGETMPAILRKWKWIRSDAGIGWFHEEQWRPPTTQVQS